MEEKVILSWSGGKDAALALHELRQSQQYRLTTLLTTVTTQYDRITMHGVRRSLLEQQAACLSLPLEEVFISAEMSDQDYASTMREILAKYLAAGVSAVAFGDVSLVEVRKYREDNLSQIGMRGIFPLWNRDSTELAHTFVSLGFEAVVTCVDFHVLDKAFVGRTYDQQFLSDLPPGVDPCGENGEFHTFVYDGPLFQKSISHQKGEVVLRDDRFYYCDLMPASH